MRKIFILALIIIGVAFLVFRGQKSVPISQNQITSPTSTIESSKVYEERENSEGEVIVTVKPLKLSSGQNTIFLVSLETHTVELDKDLKNISIVIDDKGKEYKPTNWTGGQGGHHISGNLIFPPLPKDAKSVKLTIKGIDNVDREFIWKL